MERIKLQVTGMSCKHCELAVTNAMEDIGVLTLYVCAQENIAELQYDPEKVTISAIIDEIKDCGFDAKSKI